MIVTLCTLKIAAEENAADVARQQVRIAVAVEIKLCGRAQRRVSAVGGQDFASKLVVGLVGRQRRSEILLPFRLRYDLVRAALHEHHVEYARHVARIGRAGQQPIDESRPFLR